MSSHPFVLSVCILLMTVSLGGCGSEPTPEQLRADAVLAGARAALLRGDSHGGKQSLITALSLDEAIGRKARVAEELRLLGELSAAAADFDSAFVWYARALEEFRNLTDRASVREITLALASLHRQMGDERKAFSIYVEALRLARVFKDQEGGRAIQWAMLPCARALDETDEEARILGELLQDYTTTGDVARQAAVLFESGNGKYSVRLFDRAAEEFLRSLMLADQARDSLLAIRATLRLAMTFEAAGRAHDALASYSDCLKRADRTQGATALRLEALIRVGNLYLRTRQFTEAARFFRAAHAAARASGNAIATGYLLLQLGHCEAESSRENALKNYRAGLDMFKPLAYAAGQAYALLCLGSLFEVNNQPNDALQYLKASIEQSEAVTSPRTLDDLFLSCEQAYIGARRTPAYDDAIDILLQLGRYDEAFWYVNRRDSRELFGALGDMNVEAGNDTVRPLLDAVNTARARYTGTQRQLLNLVAQGGPRKDLISDARTAQDQAFKMVTEAAAAAVQARKTLEPIVRVSSLGLPEVQKALAPGTALVQHVLARRALYAFVVTNAKVSVQVAAFERDRVFDLAREFADLLKMRDELTDSSKAQQTEVEKRLREVNGPLYEAFIRPIENAIGGQANVLVILPRELPWLPVHALSKGLLRGGYLAEQCVMSYLPSAGTVLLPRIHKGNSREVVAVGYQGGTRWDVEYELRDIRAFYKDVRLYFDQQASLFTLQKERGDVLHIAARFVFNEERPGNSSIILSDGKSAEVMKRVPLGSLLSIPLYQTVVISDLDPGRFGIRPAEPYLFLANGTQQIVFTSRTPSRKAKKIFGEVFYTALLGGASARTAYHKAQLEMIKTPEFSGPHCWAPFTLWGR